MSNFRSTSAILRSIFTTCRTRTSTSAPWSLFIKLFRPRWRCIFVKMVVNGRKSTTLSQRGETTRSTICLTTTTTKEAKMWWFRWRITMVRKWKLLSDMWVFVATLWNLIKWWLTRRNSQPCISVQLVLCIGDWARILNIHWLLPMAVRSALSSTFQPTPIWLGLTVRRLMWNLCRGNIWLTMVQSKPLPTRIWCQALFPRAVSKVCILLQNLRLRLKTLPTKAINFLCWTCMPVVPLKWMAKLIRSLWRMCKKMM